MSYMFIFLSMVAMVIIVVYITIACLLSDFNDCLQQNRKSSVIITLSLRNQHPLPLVGDIHVR